MTAGDRMDPRVHEPGLWVCVRDGGTRANNLPRGTTSGAAPAGDAVSDAGDDPRLAYL